MSVLSWLTGLNCALIKRCKRSLYRENLFILPRLSSPQTSYDVREGGRNPDAHPHLDLHLFPTPSPSDPSARSVPVGAPVPHPVLAEPVRVSEPAGDEDTGEPQTSGPSRPGPFPVRTCVHGVVGGSSVVEERDVKEEEDVE